MSIGTSVRGVSLCGKYRYLLRLLGIFLTFSTPVSFFFFLNDPATTEISPLSPHAPLPISPRRHQHTIGRDVRPTLTTAKGIESATTVRMSGWLSEHRSSGVFTPKLESGPVHGWLCHTASVAGAHGWGSTASTVDRTRSGITNSPT